MHLTDIPAELTPLDCGRRAGPLCLGGRAGISCLGSGHAKMEASSFPFAESQSRMTVLPTPEQLAELQDDQLEYLAVEWRTRASHGDREAFGVAHALEVEHRRRTRDSRLQDLPATPTPQPRRPWWKFWVSTSDDQPQRGA
jgi:hypothetical protein